MTELKHYIQQEALFELRRKLAPGVVGHISVALILLCFTPLLRDHFWPTLCLAAGIILSSLTRIPFARATEALILANSKKWKAWLYVSLFSTLISWAGLFFFAIMQYPLASLTVVLICLVAAGNTANSTSALSSNKFLARIFSSAFMGSVAIALIIKGESDSFAVILLCGAHTFYHWVQIGLHAQSFEVSKEREFKLRLLQDESDQNSLLLWGVLNGLEESVFLKNRDGVIQMVNKAGEKLFHKEAKDLVGKVFYNFVAPDIAEGLRNIDRGVMESGNPERDVQFTIHDDKTVHLSRSFFPYKDARGNIIGVLSVSRDVSEIKKYEHSLVEARNELERRVEERTRDLSILSETLIESRARLGNVLVNAPLVLWAFDKDSTITHAEGSGLRKIGVDPNTVKGRMGLEIFATNPPVLARLIRALSGESFTSEDKVKEYYFESHWTCTRDHNGVITGATCVSHDISESKISQEATLKSIRLGEIIQMQREISNSGLDPNKIMHIVCRQAKEMTNSDGAVVEIIDEARDELHFAAAAGVAVAYLGGRLPIEGSLSGEALKSREAILCDDTSNDPRMNQHAQLRKEIGSMMVVPLRHGSYMVGTLKCYSKAAHSFNDQHLQTLQLMGELLAASLSQATDFEEKTHAIESMQRTEKSLIMARAQAEAAAQTKADFLASMSHEIRTPLNGIIGMTELLIDSPLSDEQERYARIVQSSGNGLLSIINDILDFSKIDAGKMDLEDNDFDSVHLVEAQAELLAMKAREKNLSLMTFIDPKIPHYLVGDAGRISQILLNLLSNAIKFTNDGGVIVRAELISRDLTKATVRWEVIDSGIGISPKTQQKLFSPFTQAEGSTARRYGGTGLGLSISKRLVDLMGGDIGIESVEGEGATFWFTLTLPLGADHKTIQHDNNLSQSRVLVVDDDPFATEVMRSYLTQFKSDVSVCASGVIALEFMRTAKAVNRPYHVVIIDKNMEMMDGFELAHQIRMDPALASAQLILVTAFDGPGQAKAANEATFNAFLTKPVKKMEILHSVSALLGPIDQLRPVLNAKDDKLFDGINKPKESRILVVEDNSVNQLLAIQQLKKLGLSCHVVANGREALDAIKQGTFDMILMDCQMPEMDGYQATRIIRSDESGTGRHVPIIAMTANAMREDEERCRESGMDDFLSKPIKRDKLEAKLKEWLPELKRSA